MAKQTCKGSLEVLGEIGRRVALKDRDEISRVLAWEWR